MTRREVLAALAGGGAAAGCTAAGARRSALPEGEIVGLSDGFGHRLPQGFRPEPAAGAWQDVEVAIIGGGVAGLAAGYRFQHAGLRDFVILELEGQVGGTSRSGQSPVTRFPWAAHYLPLPQRENRPLVRLLEEMGAIVGSDADGNPVGAEEQLVADPEERIFYRGHWYEGLYLRAGASTEDLRQLAAFEREIDRWVAWRDARGRRAFTIPMAFGSDTDEIRALDGLSMADHLDRLGLTSPRLRWLVDYGCRDDYGLRLADTSAWAGLFYFASRVRAPGGEGQPFLAWPQGNGHLVDHLRRAIRAPVRTGVAATDLTPADGRDGPRVLVRAFDRRAGRPVGFRARRVVLAAPQFLARHLVEPYRERSPAHLEAFDYGPWLVANLTLSDRPAGHGFPLAWDNVLYESPSLGYVVATHQTDRVGLGPTVLTFYHALCDSDARRARAQLLAGSFETWADFALGEIERAHPEIRRLTTRLDIMRLGHAMVRPRVGAIWSGARERAARPIAGIHFAHSDLSGLALFEEAYYHGLRAAEEVLTALGRPPKERWAAR
jgi:hypothetical protein